MLLAALALSRKQCGSPVPSWRARDSTPDTDSNARGHRDRDRCRAPRRSASTRTPCVPVSRSTSSSGCARAWNSRAASPGVRLMASSTTCTRGRGQPHVRYSFRSVLI